MAGMAALPFQGVSRPAPHAESIVHGRLTE